MIENLFTIPIYNCFLEFDNNTLIKYINDYTNNNPSRIMSNQSGGYQSDNLNYKEDPFSLLTNKISDKLYNYGEYLKIKTPVFLDSMWFNVNHYKDYNVEHNHSGVFSGVYYVKTPKDCGNIKFFHGYFDEYNHTWSKIKFKNYNTTNSSTYMYPVNENQLFLFPSFLKHSFLPNLNQKEERISISFNFQI